MRKSKRVISKSKTFGFNPWVDQVDAISQIMAETGEKAESVVLRKLIDEALAARRQKGSSVTVSEPPGSGFGERLQTVEALLLKLVRQGETSLRIQDVSLALLQDVLAEAHAGRKVSWDALSVPELREKGNGSNEIEVEFALRTDEAKNYAYGVAEEIKKTQELRK